MHPGRPGAAQVQLEVRQALQALQRESEIASRERAQLGFEVLRKYDMLTTELYRARAQLPEQHPERRRIEDAAAEVSFELLFNSHRKRRQGAFRSFVTAYRAIWRRELYLFTYCLVLFLSCCLVGFNVAANYPEYAQVLIPQQLMEDILDNRAWYERIRDDPLGAGIGIAWNNINVAINCFLAGALLGLGGLALLCYNGVFFGAIFGYCWVNDFSDDLGEFVLSHGPLELSIIIAASFSSMLYGRAFFMRPYRLFASRLTHGGREAAIVALGVTPWLIFAACFEAFVSPFEYLTFTTKVFVGIAAALCFWLWTFWPEKETSAGERR